MFHYTGVPRGTVTSGGKSVFLTPRGAILAPGRLSATRPPLYSLQKGYNRHRTGWSPRQQLRPWPQGGLLDRWACGTTLGEGKGEGSSVYCGTTFTVETGE